MLRKNVKSLLEHFQVCIFAEIVFGVRCTLKISKNEYHVCFSKACMCTELHEQERSLAKKSWAVGVSGILTLCYQGFFF